MIDKWYQADQPKVPVVLGREPTTQQAVNTGSRGQ
jgi:hypothetical protein